MMNEEDDFHCASCSRRKPIEQLAERFGRNNTLCRCESCKGDRDANMANVRSRRAELNQTQKVVIA